MVSPKFLSVGNSIYLLIILIINCWICLLKVFYGTIEW